MAPTPLSAGVGRRRQPGPASCSRQLVPLHPGAGAEPHIQAPPLHAAGPLGSLPQHKLELLPKQLGRVPVHVPESLEASPPAASTAASHCKQCTGSSGHVHAPSTHWSAAYLLPQQPSHVTGGVPVHVAESLDASPPAASTAASHRAHDPPIDPHVHAPFMHS